MQCQFHPLGLRHLEPRPRHRHGGGKTGGDTWFFITADYAFGQALERDTAAVVEANGGKVLGRVRAPLNNNDFSSFLLQAQSSKAKVIGLANAGGDTINSIKQAAEFGIVRSGQSLAGLPVFTADVAALGLPLAQGLVLTETWYWDMNEANRAWTKRRQAERSGKVPTMVHAGVYSGVLHYLKAVEALKADGDGRAVTATMKEMTTDDPLFGKGTVRRRPLDRRRLPVRGEEARGIKIFWRSLQDARDHSSSGSIPSTEGRRVPANQRNEPRPRLN
jgi:ABC-type branched-subunit amino acid transport system substrate-binding protein